jgi:hypothetical protein
VKGLEPERGSAVKKTPQCGVFRRETERAKRARC